MHSYLRNRKQQIQINNKFSSENIVIDGFPQGSIDGPFLNYLSTILSFLYNTVL